MYTIDDLMQDYSNAKDVFPLQTNGSLSKRWGVSRQVVQNWAKRDTEFPPAVTGLVEGGKHVNDIYPYYRIEEYEKRKGIVK